MSTNMEVQREKAEVWKNLEKEELLTDKNKKQISEEFITDNGHERRMREIKRTNKWQQPSEMWVTHKTTGKCLLASAYQELCWCFPRR